MEKKPIGIVADEAADLPEELRNKYQIENVLYKVSFPQEEFEGIRLKGNFYQKIREAVKLPFTSFPQARDFQKAYQKALEKFDRILVIVISSTLSKAYAHGALIAKQKMDLKDQKRIEVFDSFLGATAQGLLVMKAQELINQGREMKEILAYLSKFKKKIKLFGFLEDVKWLKAGGRISSPLAKVLEALQNKGIRPAIGLKNGKIVMAGIRFSAKDRVRTILKEIKKQKKRGEIKIAIDHADVIDETQRLKRGIEELGQEVLFISLLSPALGAHTGPGTLIVSYYFGKE